MSDNKLAARSLVHPPRPTRHAGKDTPDLIWLDGQILSAIHGYVRARRTGKADPQEWNAWLAERLHDATTTVESAHPLFATPAEVIAE